MEKQGEYLSTFEKRENSEHNLEVLKIPEVRTSSICQLRIQDEQGRYALVANYNKLKKDIVHLTAIGGGFQVTPDGAANLEKLLGINKEKFSQNPDLRFSLKGTKANQYREWFLKREGRDVTPDREAKEELVDETQLLLNEEVKNLEFHLSGYSVQLQETGRPGHEGELTLRFIEVFDVKMDQSAFDKLQKKSHGQTPIIYFVTAEEIINGETKEGISIGPSSKGLLRPKDTIKPFV